jgi:hypothetical protein
MRIARIRILSTETLEDFAAAMPFTVEMVFTVQHTQLAVASTARSVDSTTVEPPEALPLVVSQAWEGFTAVGATAVEAMAAGDTGKNLSM